MGPSQAAAKRSFSPRLLNLYTWSARTCLDRRRALSAKHIATFMPAVRALADLLRTGDIVGSGDSDGDVSFIVQATCVACSYAAGGVGEFGE